jgi:hypothetical protein
LEDNDLRHGADGGLVEADEGTLEKYWSKR